MLRVSGIRVAPGTDEKHLIAAAASRLRVPPTCVKGIRIVKKSVDARDKKEIRIIYTLDVTLTKPENSVLSVLPSGICTRVEKEKPFTVSPARVPGPVPVVVGLGPGGLFAALYLAMAGLRPLILERGEPVEQRRNTVDIFHTNGSLDPESNVQFGEGGAGAFSDGKLTTGIKDERCRAVTEILIRHGAPEEIGFLARPHIGTDRLPQVVSSIRKEIERLGGRVLFSSRLCDLRTEKDRLTGIVWKDRNGIHEQECERMILAIGHSASDTQQMLFERGVNMVRKPFSVGVRIEHPRYLIDRAQYGEYAGNRDLGAAEYHLSTHLKDGRGVYTFCMCPGGTVVASASREGGVCTNGMSVFSRDGENSNAALLVDVRTDDFPDSHPLSGYVLQRMWEERAFRAGGGGYRAPVQRVEDFLNGRETARLGDIRPTYLPGVTEADLRFVLPQELIEDLRQGILQFDRQLRGFAHPDAVLTAVESRSSCPVRVTRNELGECNISGIFPCGEGAGYAGGIMSAAVDGLRQAEALVRSASL